MQIKRITLSGFKGVRAVYDLERFNLLTGPNGSGKSAILQALQWAIEGRTPLGSTLDASAQLFGPAGGEVSVELDDGFAWTRRLSIDHRDKKKSMTVIVAGNSAAGKADGEAIIVEHLGRGGELFAPMFDLRNFLDLSDDKRREFVLALCAKAGRKVKGEKLVSRVMHEYFVDVLGEGTVGKRSNESCIDDLSESQCAALGTVDAALQMAPPGDLASSIAAFAEIARDISLRSKKAKDEARQAARQLSDRKAELEVVAEKVEDLEAQAKDIAGQVLDTERQIAHQKGLAESQEVLAGELFRLQESEKEIAARLAAPFDDATLSALETELAGVNTAYAYPDVQFARDRFADLRNQLFAAQRQDDGWRTELKALTAERIRLDAERADCEANPWVVLKAKLEAIELELHDTIVGRPATLLAECRGTVDAWAMTIVDKLARCTTRLKQLEIDIPEAEEKLAKALTDIQTLTVQTNSAKEALALADATTLTIQAKQKADDARRHDLSRRVLALQKERDLRAAEQADLAELRDSIAAAQSRADAIVAQHGVAPKAELENLLAMLTDQQTKTDARLNHKRRAEALAGDYTACLAKAEADEALYDCAELIRAAIRRVRETIMVELVEPLLSKMGTFLTAAMGEDVAPYCRLENDRERPIFELGWNIADGNRIPEPAMSGGEHCIFAAALAFALVELADPPLKLLMIEGAELDAMHLGQALGAIERCFATGCALLATYSDREYLGSWNQIRVAQREAVAA